MQAGVVGAAIVLQYKINHDFFMMIAIPEKVWLFFFMTALI